MIKRLLVLALSVCLPAAAAVDQFEPYAKVGEAAPTKQSDTTAIRERADAYGSVSTVDGRSRKMLVEEGSYFVAQNTNAITGIASALVVTQVDTTPFIVIENVEATGGKSLYIDFVKLRWTAAGVNSTSAHVLAEIDAGAATAGRTATGGTVLVPVNPNPSYTTTPSPVITVGAITAGAATSSRKKIARSVVRSQIPLINDEALLDFTGEASGVGVNLGVVTAVRQVIPMTPVKLLPGKALLIHLYQVANDTTPPSLAVEITGYLR